MPQHLKMGSVGAARHKQVHRPKEGDFVCHLGLLGMIYLLSWIFIRVYVCIFVF